MNWEDLKQASIEETIVWAAPQKWCTAMAACLQDNQKRYREIVATLRSAHLG